MKTQYLFDTYSSYLLISWVWFGTKCVFTHSRSVFTHNLQLHCDF